MQYVKRSINSSISVSKISSNSSLSKLGGATVVVAPKLVDVQGTLFVEGGSSDAVVCVDVDLGISVVGVGVDAVSGSLRVFSLSSCREASRAAKARFLAPPKNFLAPLASKFVVLAACSRMAFDLYPGLLGSTSTSRFIWYAPSTTSFAMRVVV